jgi:hypothetical protein
MLLACGFSDEVGLRIFSRANLFRADTGGQFRIMHMSLGINSGISTISELRNDDVSALTLFRIMCQIFFAS